MTHPDHETVPAHASTLSAAAPAAVSRGVRIASFAVFVTFLLNGFNFASWASRLPAVRDELGMRPEQLGLLLLVGAIGSIAALPLSGMVVQRLGARRTILGFAVVDVVGLLLAATGVALGALWLVVLALVLFGIGTGVWDAALNLEGAAVERQLGKAIMPRFHAGFSFGTMAGAGLGALAALLGAPVVLHLAVALTLSLLGVIVCSRYLLPEGTHNGVPDPDGDGDGSTAASADGAPARRVFNAWTEPRTLLIGLVVLAAALTEGAANDWVSLAVVDGFDTTHALGAVAFGVFVTAMTGMRLLGTGLLDRWGRVAVLRVSAALSLVGLVIFGVVPSLWISMVGVVLWGMGAALGFPVGMSAASDDPRRAAPRVAVVATIGYSAFFAGPPLLGMLAEHVGYRHALLAIAIPVVIGLLVIPAARPLPTAAGSHVGRTVDV